MGKFEIAHSAAFEKLRTKLNDAVIEFMTHVDNEPVHELRLIKKAMLGKILSNTLIVPIGKILMCALPREMSSSIAPKMCEELIGAYIDHQDEHREGVQLAATVDIRMLCGPNEVEYKKSVEQLSKLFIEFGRRTVEVLEKKFGERNRRPPKNTSPSPDPH
jgi:hypothetical protein